MNIMRHAARIFADEGLTNLVRRACSKLTRPSRREESIAVHQPLPFVVNDEIERAKSTFQDQLAEFRLRTKNAGWDGMEHFYWYHAVDVGNGLVTPGDYDFRTSLPSFGFPDDMKGMRVLDVGSATGFFAFEFERRGAEVVSVELPSLSTWDILEADRAQLDIDLMAWLQCDSPQEAYRRHLDGPFQFCHSMLGSRVNRCYSSIYDLTLAKVGGEKFDLIYAGDILLHLFSPLKALDVLSGLCRGTLLATTEGAFPVATSLPMMEFRGTISQGKDRRTWWNLNNECLTEILKRVGFRSVAPVGRFSGIISRVWWKFERDVLRAVK